MPSTDSPSPARLPYELIELIIREAWLSHDLTLRERMDMYTSFSLVSLDFAWDFTRIFTSDVHIFNHAHYEYYIHRAYRNDTHFLRMMGKLGRCLNARTSCRSITAHRPEHPEQSEIDFDRLAVYEHVASTIQVTFPGVHSFGIVYHDWTVNDGNLASLSLPKQVEVLQVTQVRSAKLASHGREHDFKLGTLPRQWRYSVATAVLPHILQLEVFGGNTALVTALTKACPNIFGTSHSLGPKRLSVEGYLVCVQDLSGGVQMYSKLAWHCLGFLPGHPANQEGDYAMVWYGNDDDRREDGTVLFVDRGNDTHGLWSRLVRGNIESAFPAESTNGETSGAKMKKLMVFYVPASKSELEVVSICSDTVTGVTEVRIGYRLNYSIGRETTGNVEERR
ncbi:hypothetical protein CPB85DRAFT_1252532 [Mucidula mucida]|nr:hypothetical protein CPB85DRAFT_1252532 [Mucidula mucida]